MSLVAASNSRPRWLRSSNATRRHGAFQPPAAWDAAQRADYFGDSAAELTLGINENLTQFVHQLIQVLLVGFTIGMMRTVVPALAESEFGVAKGSFMLLSAFVVAFGIVKGTLNFVAGRLSERIGRKRVLLFGWIAAIPIPFMIYFAPSWGWISPR